LAEIEEISKVCGNRSGICNIYHWLRGMEAPDYSSWCHSSRLPHGPPPSLYSTGPYRILRPYKFTKDIRNTIEFEVKVFNN